MNRKLLALVFVFVSAVVFFPATASADVLIRTVTITVPAGTIAGQTCVIEATATVYCPNLGGLSLDAKIFKDPAHVMLDHEYSYDTFACIFPAAQLDVSVYGAFTYADGDYVSIELRGAGDGYDPASPPPDDASGIDINYSIECSGAAPTPSPAPTPTPVPLCALEECAGLGDFTLSPSCEFPRFGDTEAFGVCLDAMTVLQYSVSISTSSLITSTYACLSIRDDGVLIDTFAADVLTSTVTDWVIVQTLPATRRVHNLSFENCADTFLNVTACASPVDRPPLPPGGACGYIANAAFAGSGAPWAPSSAAPSGDLAVIADGYADIPLLAAISQEITATSEVTTSRTFTLTVRAAAQRLRPAAFDVVIHFADDSEETLSFDLLSSDVEEFVETFVADSTPVLIEVYAVPTSIWGGGNTARVSFVCLTDDETEVIPEPPPVETGCGVCNSAIPAGCDTSLDGDCAYYGNSFAFDELSIDNFWRIADVVVRAFRWLKCWIVCLFSDLFALLERLFRELIDAIANLFTCLILDVICKLQQIASLLVVFIYYATTSIWAIAAWIAQLAEFIQSLKILLLSVSELFYTIVPLETAISHVFWQFLVWLEGIFSPTITDYEITFMNADCFFYAVRLWDWLASNTVLAWYYVLALVVLIVENVLWFLNYFSE